VRRLHAPARIRAQWQKAVITFLIGLALESRRANLKDAEVHTVLNTYSVALYERLTAGCHGA
jgi:hypothetical protein